MLKSVSVVAAIVLALVASTAFAGARFELDPSKAEVIMKASMVYYGEAVDPTIAAKATKEIQDMWSGLSLRAADPAQVLTVQVQGKTYTLRAVLSEEIITVAEAQKRAALNRDPSVNFIRFRKGGGAGDRSYYHDLGANSGVFYESDGIGTSTTASHEFGHGLGLDHPNQYDWRGMGRPAIMCPRGTIVDAAYQWNPKAAPGAAGGTMSPAWRLVSQWDVDNVGIGSLGFDSAGMATVGYASNVIEISPVSFSFDIFHLIYEGFYSELNFFQQ